MTATAPRAAVSPALVAWVTREEGVRLMPYRDAAGLLTIGVGRCLDRVGISREEAQALLSADLARAARDVAAIAPWSASLDEVRWSVLVALAFQLGGVGLAKFHRTLNAIHRADFAAAARHLLASRWADQTPARAWRTAEAMRTGTWPHEE